MNTAHASSISEEDLRAMSNEHLIVGNTDDGSIDQ